jgi:hypothetical protein
MQSLPWAVLRSNLTSGTRTMLEGLDLVEWAAFPGPESFDPAEVPRALTAVSRATSAAGAREASSRVLFAIGNDHRGTLYPVALPAAPFLLEVVRDGARWARLAAITALADAVLFSPEEGHEVVRYNAGPALAPKPAFTEAVRRGTDTFFTILVDECEYDDVRIAVLDLLDAVRADDARLMEALRPHGVGLPDEEDADARRDLVRALRAKPLTEFATACRLWTLERDLAGD